MTPSGYLQTVLPNGYGSIPINTIFRGMNIHLPAILMFTRGTRFWHTAIFFHRTLYFFLSFPKVQQLCAASQAERNRRVSGLHMAIASGNLTVCYWKWPFIVDLPIKNCDFHSYVSLPEGSQLPCLIRVATSLTRHPASPIRIFRSTLGTARVVCGNAVRNQFSRWFHCG